jgi:transcriptional regulator with XRE-family HTH domain
VPEDVPLSYAKAVGDRLRNLRKQRGLSLLAVEQMSDREFKASVLGAYERGERIISVLRLQRLAHLYRVPVDQVLPRPGLLGATAAPDGNGNGSESAERHDPRRPIRIDLVRLADVDTPERDVIRRYVNMIQLQRGDIQGRSIALREEDLLALGRFFERDAPSMELRLRELKLHY